MGLIKILTSLGFIALFTFVLITYLVGFSNDNSPPVSITNDSGLSNLRVYINENLSEFHEQSGDSLEALWQSEITEGDETTRTGGQFKTNPTSVFGTTKLIISQVFFVLFGDDIAFGIVLTTFLTFIGFIIGLYVWKTWKGGSPD